MSSMSDREFTLRRLSLDEALNKITYGRFAESLDSVCKEHYDFLEDDDPLGVQLEIADGFDVRLSIEKRHVQRVGYSPSKWNTWPRVRPPEGVWMRVRGPQKAMKTYRNVLVFREGAWWNTAGDRVALDAGVVFKPFSD